METGAGKRNLWVDLLRSLALINMVVYHFLYDLVYIFDWSIPWFEGDPGYFGQQSICSLFIFLSGYSYSFSRNPLKNGIKFFAAGLLVHIVTVLVVPEEQILFGVLQFMGLSMILTALLEKYGRRILSWFEQIRGSALGSFIFFLVIYVFFRSDFYTDSLYLVLNQFFTQYGNRFFIFGFRNESFFSTDYFPLIPWYPLFLFGLFSAKLGLLDSGRYNPLWHRIKGP